MKKNTLIRLRFWIFTLVGFIIISLFFLYGFYFNIWGKKFTELPFWVNVGFVCFGIVFFIFPIIYSKFYEKHRSVIYRKKSNKK